MEGPGGIGGNEFDVHAPARAGGRSTVVRALGEDSRVIGREGIVGESKIDEPRASDDTLAHDGGWQGKLCKHALGHRSRIAAFTLGELHREVGGEITVGGVAGTLERELDVGTTKRRCDPGQLVAENFAHEASAEPFDFGAGGATAGVATGFPAG